MEPGATPLEEFAAEASDRFARVEERFARVEERFDRVEARLDMTATKADLADLRTEMHKEFAAMVKWVVGTAVVLGAAAITIITFVLNYATPRRNLPAPQVQQTPVIIQLPPYPAPR
ncbi:MAG: hypothetical protein V4693_20510 [Pseudomonadota bacterium]